MNQHDPVHPFENAWCTIPESWACIDCGINTAPGIPVRAQVEQAFAADWSDQEPDLSPSHDEQAFDVARARYRLQKLNNGVGEGSIDYYISDRCEIYMIEPKVWEAAGMGPMAGCLCIGCLEKRLGRILTPTDFLRHHSFHLFPGTQRLLARRDGDADRINANGTFRSRQTNNKEDSMETYLGDGLYASFDGFMITLRAPREGGDHFVYLEPNTFAALLEFQKRIA